MESSKGAIPVFFIVALLILAALTGGVYPIMVKASRVTTVNREKQALARMYEIRDAIVRFFMSHSKEAAGRLPSPEISNRVPASRLGLDPIYVHDPWGRAFYYYRAASITGVSIDGRKAAGYLISGGPDQVLDTTVGGDSVIAGDKDILVPIHLQAEAVAIVRQDLLTLSKAQWAYFCKCHADPNPPIIAEAVTIDTIISSFHLADRYKMDPWGNAYKLPAGVSGAFYSIGPDGVDDNRYGDDISVPLISKACPATNTNLLSNNSFEPRMNAAER